jgi:hypothetical protein
MGLWLHADWDCWMLAAWIWRETSRIWRRMASPECDPWLILARRCTCRPKCKSLSPQHFSQPIQTTFNMFVSPYNFVSFSVEVFFNMFALHRPTFMAILHDCETWLFFLTFRCFLQAWYTTHFSGHWSGFSCGIYLARSFAVYICKRS